MSIESYDKLQRKFACMKTYFLEYRHFLKLIFFGLNCKFPKLSIFSYQANLCLLRWYSLLQIASSISLLNYLLNNIRTCFANGIFLGFQAAEPGKSVESLKTLAGFNRIFICVPPARFMNVSNRFLVSLAVMGILD